MKPAWLLRHRHERKYSLKATSYGLRAARLYISMGQQSAISLQLSGSTFQKTAMSCEILYFEKKCFPIYRKALREAHI